MGVVADFQGSTPSAVESPSLDNLEVLNQPRTRLYLSDALRTDLIPRDTCEIIIAVSEQRPVLCVPGGKTQAGGSQEKHVPPDQVVDPVRIQGFLRHRCTGRATRLKEGGRAGWIVARGCFDGQAFKNWNEE